MIFLSKRNQVFLEQGVVIKRFSDVSALQREAEALAALGSAGLAVPQLLSRDDDVLKLEYIPGVLYVDLVDHLTEAQALALADWLVQHHRLTGALKGDVNLRNFLWTGEQCVGLDFEEPPLMGEMECDFGRVAAFAAAYRPAFTEERLKSLAKMLGVFVQLGAEAEKIREGYLGELRAMNLRRREYIDLAQAEQFFADCLARVQGRQMGGVSDGCAAED